ncbi:MAG: acyltransferase family protein [Verrucomicrobiota bacterium]
MREASHYRPEIDGLRALAVLAVVVFHFDRSWLGGGFVGVDVFFVISGFLVTSILLRDHKAGSFSLLRFYQRRIARIFPAVLVMAIVTLGASALWHTTWDLANTSAAFSASVLSIVNFHLAMQGDYFQMSEDAQPLLHCWSLAIEEQYYLLFPVLLWMVLKAGRRGGLLILGLVASASFLACILRTNQNPSAAFFFLPYRAWELLSGSLIAMAGLQLRTASSQVNTGVFAAGMTILILSFFLLREDEGFPGWVAGWSVLGTALVLVASETGVGRWLLSRPFAVGVGKRSYSLYLWHWPVFSFVDYVLPFEPPFVRFIVKLVLTSLATWLSYRLIERPCRKKLNLPTNRALAFGFLALTLLSLGPMGYALRKTFYIDGSDGTKGERIFPRDRATGTLILMGDSHATALGPVIRNMAEERNWRLVVLSFAGGDPLPHSDGNSSPLWESNRAVIEREKPRHLVLICDWHSKLEKDPGRLRLALGHLSPHVDHITLLTVPPRRPESASRSSIRKGSRAPFFESPGELAKRQAVSRLLKKEAGVKVRLLDSSASFVRADQSVIVFDEGDHPLFHDHVHLSGRGVQRLRPRLEELLK